MAQSPIGGKSLGGIPQGSIVGPVLFNLFISDLDNGTEYTLSQFTDDTNLGGVTDAPDGCTARDRLENWTERKLEQFNKGKCKVLHLRRNNPRRWYMLEANWLENSFGKKDPGVLVDSELAMS